MKILIVSPKFHPIIGGGETFVLHSAEQLHSAGHKVCVAVEPHIDRKSIDYEYEVTEIDGLSDSNLDIIKSVNGLYNVINSFKPDVIHLHGYFALIAISLANSNIPIVASIHSTPVWGERIIGGMDGFDQEKIFAENSFKFFKPNLVTAANDVYEKAAIKLADGNVHVKIFPYPILNDFYEDHDKKYFRDKFRLTEDKTLLMLPSRIIERKGILEAVEALAMLPHNFLLCLPCASEPLDMAYWKNITQSEAFKNNSDRIIIPNSRILPNKMPLLYAASDIVLMPSYYEGAPVATVEAMASKKPFIGADSQGINGFIRNNDNGILVSQKSSQELADAIINLSKNKELQIKFGEQAYLDVQKLSWKAQLPKLEELYMSILN